jgi:hypothetical protein
MWGITVATLPVPTRRVRASVHDWLLEGYTPGSDDHAQAREAHDQHPWWKVMCLTGLDYYSTLGYQPGIAFLAAGALAPLATLILVLVTLLGAVPVYHRVAEASPHGEGSIAMLERLLSWWQGKFFVLMLLGFVATDFIITITLSAADASAHVLENPYAPAALESHQLTVTLILIASLAAIFLRGFREAIGIAVVLVGVYLALNAVVIGVGLVELWQHPAYLANWRHALWAEEPNPLLMIGVAALLFPRLALGLSGFETGVAVMPLVAGDPEDSEAYPGGRIRNTRKLLTTAALIMSAFLMTSSVVTSMLIPQEAWDSGEAGSRALAWVAHDLLGDAFGTVYDISTISILWFAGASAMAGLLHIVPKYLPRDGMAPDWTRTTRTLVLVFGLVAVAVTVIFRADVEAQGGAYATGVLVMITSAAFAVSLAMREHGRRRLFPAFVAITAVFLYTTVVNVFERPDGIRIATFFIGAIVVTSLVSRVWRSTELRAERVVFDEEALRFIRQSAEMGPVRLIANHPDERTPREYLLKERGEREASHIPYHGKLLFLEVVVTDASDFAGEIRVNGEQVGPYRVLRVHSSSVPNAIAATLLAIRDMTGERPHAYFGWTEGNPLRYLARFILFGEGDIAPVTHEILRRGVPDPARRPAVHVG